ncbi:hypothetical protein Noc_2906 [Nitrosococcus oceani ATCC 19707]|uniref:Uncharacterized protein n=1 Tax=Nitrosococcus oceani (strain ATCC 19707 / BCRC 17464 / JCM 30415 / NCIMB 11848 / C-107) TaxID=323261 RepID=Q3J744_NITOC|nr:hypothetical protein Noc_2906 [Nitrosococcus oceani ATCC 19707]
MFRRFILLIKQAADRLNMVAKFWIVDLPEYGQINFIGQQQIVQRQADPVQGSQIDITLQRQVDIRAGAVAAQGTGAVQSCAADRREPRQHLANILPLLPGEAVAGHCPAAFNSARR